MHTMIIISCPRSGSTLLQNLITTCYVDMVTPVTFEQAPAPVAWSQIREEKPDAKWAVFKVPEMGLDRPSFLRRGCEAGWHVVGLIRDLRAVLTSTSTDGGPYYGRFDPLNRQPVERWVANATFMVGLQEEMGARFHLVKFEDLILTPDTVQEDLSKVWPDLEILYPFSVGHAVMEPDEKSANVMNGVRPMDVGRVKGAAEDVLAKMGYDLTPAKGLLEHFGYL